MSLKTPLHPGRIIREEIIESAGLTVSDAAKRLGVARPSLSKLLNEKAALSPHMALKIEHVFGPKADIMLHMQIDYDLAHARRILQDSSRHPV